MSSRDPKSTDVKVTNPTFGDKKVGLNHLEEVSYPARCSVRT